METALLRRLDQHKDFRYRRIPCRDTSNEKGVDRIVNIQSFQVIVKLIIHLDKVEDYIIDIIKLEEKNKV